MTEVPSLLCAPSAPCVSAQAAGRLGVSGAMQRRRPPCSDSPVGRGVPLPASHHSPYLEGLAALTPDQENDIP